MNKRIVTFLFSLVLLLISGCGHTHKAEETWNFDTENHWHRCECGDVLDSEAHVLEENFCTVCRCKVLFFEDGSAQVSIHDENGNSLLAISYLPDAKGNLTEDLREEYEWNTKGLVTLSRNYRNGMMIGETKYEYNSDGEITGYLITEYWEDESKVIYQYDANMQLIRKNAYDPAGNEISG